MNRHNSYLLNQLQRQHRNLLQNSRQNMHRLRNLNQHPYQHRSLHQAKNVGQTNAILMYTAPPLVKEGAGVATAIVAALTLVFTKRATRPSNNATRREWLNYKPLKY